MKNKIVKKKKEGQKERGYSVEGVGLPLSRMNLQFERVERVETLFILVYVSGEVTSRDATT